MKFFWCKAFWEGSYYNYNIVFNYYYYYYYYVFIYLFIFIYFFIGGYDKRSNILAGKKCWENYMIFKLPWLAK